VEILTRNSEGEGGHGGGRSGRGRGRGGALLSSDARIDA
jgi:hypothetical protein